MIRQIGEVITETALPVIFPSARSVAEEIGYILDNTDDNRNGDWWLAPVIKTRGQTLVIASMDRKVPVFEWAKHCEELLLRWETARPPDLPGSPYVGIFDHRQGDLFLHQLERSGLETAKTSEFAPPGRFGLFPVD